VFELVELDGGKHYDLVVIGGGSGGLACSKEGESITTLKLRPILPLSCNPYSCYTIFSSSSIYNYCHWQCCTVLSV